MSFTIKEPPVFAKRGASFPRKKLFKELRDIYLARNGVLIKDICEILGEVPQTVSAWASGNTRRSPPWWAIMRLCHELDYQIVLRADEVLVLHTDQAIGESTIDQNGL